jgi:ABC-type glycerol-3-phosphate transport system substrate-binding protein
MKNKLEKFALLISAFALCLGFAGCTGSANDSSSSSAAAPETEASITETNETAENTEEISEENSSVDSKILVAYYSAQEHTKRAAELVADTLDADIFVITPAEEYSSADLDWTDDSSRVVREHEDENRHTELVSTDVDGWEDYDTVLIGYPIWWQEAAWVVDDFVKDNDFTGKTVIPFCTSTSSGIGESGRLLAEMAGTGNWQEGQRFSQSFDENDVIDWANGLGIN